MIPLAMVYTKKPRGWIFYLSSLCLLAATITAWNNPSDEVGRSLFLAFAAYFFIFFAFRDKWDGETISAYSVFNGGERLGGEISTNNFIGSAGGEVKKGGEVVLTKEKEAVVGEAEILRRRAARLKAAEGRMERSCGATSTLSILLVCLVGISTILGDRADALAFGTTTSPISRRSALVSTTTGMICALVPSKSSASTLLEDRSQVTVAISQLDSIPDLIKGEKWDLIRAVLVKPPLSDCWATNSPFLKGYAEKLEDELKGLEAREDAVSHLRYLDMAAYNNVFNPIATEGTSGATKELVRSYYEDPGNELRASLEALKSLEALGK